MGESSIDILFIVENANLRGGTEILSFHLLRSLRDKGYKVFLLSLVPYEGDESNVLSFNLGEFKKWENISNKLYNKLLFNAISDNYLRKLINKMIAQLNPTLVVNHTYDIITALPRQKNVDQMLHWSIRGYEDSLLGLIYKKSLLKRILSLFCVKGLFFRRHKELSKIGELIILSNAAKAELVSINPNIREDKIQVIPNPLPVEKDSLQVSNLKNKNIVFVGRLSHEKGVMRLLRIWEKVQQHIPEYTLSIYGEGGAKDEMIDYISRKHIKNVAFCGFSNQLDQIYLNSDLLCMTSDTEGFGMVLIEAMYYGVPVISFDCPVSPKEIISNAGIVVPCFDEDKYAQEIVTLLSDYDFRMELQRKGLDRVKDFYIDNVLQKWINLLKK